MGKRYPSSGQALITLLFTVVIGMLVTTGAIMTLVNAYKSLSDQELTTFAYITAETGMENGILRIMRDPSYTGETIVLDGNRTSVVTVTQAPGYVLLSVGSVGSVTRKIQVNAHFTGLTFIIDSWKEVP